MTKAFDKIAAGLADAIAYAEGDTTKGRVAAGPDVKAIRAKTKLSQAKFAEKLRLPVATVRDWEQHRRSPDAPARTLLGMVDADPKGALALIERMGDRAVTNPREMAAAFAADFMDMEYALKRSGFLRKGQKIAQADWERFAAQLGDAFFEEVRASGIAKTLISQPPRQLLTDLTWSPDNPSPLNNVIQLIVNGVCRVRNSYFHGEKFVGGPDGQWERDATLVAEAHAVLRTAMESRSGASTTSIPI